MGKIRLRNKILKTSVSILTILGITGFFYLPVAYNALAADAPNAEKVKLLQKNEAYGQSGTFLDDKLTQENIYQTEIPTSFSMNYSKDWYCDEFIDESTATKVLVFANHENPGQIRDDNMPDDLLAYSALIAPKDQINYEQLLQRLNELDKVASEKITYEAGKDKKVNFYLLTKKSEQEDFTWQAELPLAMAFTENENYVYLFATYTGIPSGVEGQMKEIDELKKTLASFKFKTAAEQDNVYENNKQGFTMNYLPDWYAIEEGDNYTGEKFTTFSNYKDARSFGQEGNWPKDFAAYYVSIYPKNDPEKVAKFQELKSQTEKASNKQEQFDAGKGEKITLYHITERTEDKDNLSWDVVLPWGRAFLEDCNYGYVFYIATEIPGGSEGQKVELDAMKKSLESFKFNEADKLNPFRDGAVEI